MRNKTRPEKRLCPRGCTIDKLINDDLEKSLYVLFKDTGVHVLDWNMMNNTYPKYRSYDDMLANMFDELEETRMYNIL